MKKNNKSKKKEKVDDLMIRRQFLEKELKRKREKVEHLIIRMQVLEEKRIEQERDLVVIIEVIREIQLEIKKTLEELDKMEKIKN